VSTAACRERCILEAVTLSAYDSAAHLDDRHFSLGEDYSVQPDENHAVQPGEDHAVQPDENHAVQPGEDHAVQPGEDHAVQPGEDHAVQPGETSDANTDEDGSDRAHQMGGRVGECELAFAGLEQPDGLERERRERGERATEADTEDQKGRFTLESEQEAEREAPEEVHKERIEKAGFDPFAEKVSSQRAEDAAGTDERELDHAAHLATKRPARTAAKPRR